MAITNDVTHSAPTRRRGRPAKAPAPKIEVPLASCIRGLDDKSRRVIERATRILEEHAVYMAEAMSDPRTVRAHLQLKLSGLDREEFHAVWLDAQHQVIAFECLATGTLTALPA